MRFTIQVGTICYMQCVCGFVCVCMYICVHIISMYTYRMKVVYESVIGSV